MRLILLPNTDSLREKERATLPASKTNLDNYDNFGFIQINCPVLLTKYAQDPTKYATNSTKYA